MSVEEYLKRNPTGSACWIDLPVLDMDRAKTFYQTLFPLWEFKSLCGPDSPMTYARFAPKETTPKPDAGVAFYQVSNVEDIGSKGAVMYFFVAPQDAQRVNEAIPESGGKFLTEYEPAGPGGKSRKFLDSEGNRVAFYTFDGA